MAVHAEVLSCSAGMEKLVAELLSCSAGVEKLVDAEGLSCSAGVEKVVHAEALPCCREEVACWCTRYLDMLQSDGFLAGVEQSFVKKESNS